MPLPLTSQTDCHKIQSVVSPKIRQRVGIFPYCLFRYRGIKNFDLFRRDLPVFQQPDFV